MRAYLRIWRFAERKTEKVNNLDYRNHPQARDRPRLLKTMGASENFLSLFKYSAPNETI